MRVTSALDEFAENAVEEREEDPSGWSLKARRSCFYPYRENCTRAQIMPIIHGRVLT